MWIRDLTHGNGNASSTEMQADMKAFTLRHSLHKRITFKSKFEEAVWNEDRSYLDSLGCWKRKIPVGGNFQQRILPKHGRLACCHRPLLHTAAWDRDKTLNGKELLSL